MKDISKQIAAYEEILEVVNKHKDIVDSYHVCLDSVGDVLDNMKVSQRFGVPLRSITGNYHGWLSVSDRYTDTIHLGYFSGKEEGRTIPWSDDGSQPADEWLLVIGFPTGAYIFGDYMGNKYPKKTFNAFFEELKAFGPAFCDTNNHVLYFREDKSKEVYEALWPLFDKYKALVEEEYREQRRAELQRELENLK